MPPCEPLRSSPPPSLWRRLPAPPSRSRRRSIGSRPAIPRSALLPPRAVAAYKRAADDVARMPRVELRVEAPPNAQNDATVRVDGAAAAGPVTVTMGKHFVAVSAPGYEPWAGVVNAQNAVERV